MSYREILLKQSEPLEKHEVSTLEEWLAALREDTEAFGTTPEDAARIQIIEAKLASQGKAQEV